MVTVRETQKVQNDNTKHVAAHSPGAKKVRIEWLKLAATGCTPGMGVIRGTTAGGEGTCTPTDGPGDELVYGISELDQKQIANCLGVYTNGDLIPVITIEGNDGLILRNIFIQDPSADIEADKAFAAGLAGGFCVSPGTGRVYVRSEYFVADADDPTRIVARISQTLEVA